MQILIPYRNPTTFTMKMHFLPKIDCVRHFYNHFYSVPGTRYSRVRGCRCSMLYHFSAWQSVQLLGSRQYSTPSRVRFRDAIQSYSAGDA